MSDTFILDWRCISVGMPDTVAERQGITIRVRQGVWRDWDDASEQRFPNDAAATSPSYRLVIDDTNGQVLGGTLYGPDAGRCVDELRELIASPASAEVWSGSDRLQAVTS
ncbi:hypothetical protein [Rhodopirellula sp. MGV]|uniref:hypothetical protein n=1 Tax=Rhodopirellula sp. MGV TaxID=2023130 RepID=UPI000B97C5AA|nr:hypothetical protein [Rhodopirellula sp. MGV]OYP30476.1 hypothetical protein CGZ80_22325 [Rhodopirellula sp. MGV]PNY33544.1 hypothetical protein C2E31_28080 [Rhodopirellula baltica]